jgi:hypothetical protein
MTSAEAYNNNIEELALEISAGTIAVDEVSAVNNSGNPDYSLLQNSPNPFSNNTQVTFTVPNNEQVSIVIYDMLGNKAAIFEGFYSAGKHTVIWDGSNGNGTKLNDGTYFCRMRSGKYTKVVKMTLLR